MKKNTICLWFNHDAEEAARFYARTFPDSQVAAVHRAPADFPGGKKDAILTVERKRGAFSLLQGRVKPSWMARRVGRREGNDLDECGVGALIRQESRLLTPGRRSWLFSSGRVARVLAFGDLDSFFGGRSILIIDVLFHDRERRIAAGDAGVAWAPEVVAP